MRRTTCAGGGTPGGCSTSATCRSPSARPSWSAWPQVPLSSLARWPSPLPLCSKKKQKAKRVTVSTVLRDCLAGTLGTGGSHAVARERALNPVLVCANPFTTMLLLTTAKLWALRRGLARAGAPGQRRQRGQQRRRPLAAALRLHHAALLHGPPPVPGADAGRLPACPSLKVAASLSLTV